MLSTLPTEANQDTPELGLLVERALKQTVERGGTYAVVPVPWARCWWDVIVLTGDNGFAWYEHCGVHEADDDASRVSQQWDFEYARIDGEGNFLICLLPPGHEGECGYSWLL